MPSDARDIGALLGSNVVTVASSRLRMQKNRAWLAQALFFQIHHKKQNQYDNIKSRLHQASRGREASL